MKTGTAPGCFLYIICENGSDGWPVKVGISSSPKARMHSLQSGHYKKLRVFNSFLFGSRREAALAEKEFHEAYSEYRMSGEWFGITPYQATDAITKYLQSGFYSEHEGVA